MEEGEATAGDPAERALQRSLQALVWDPVAIHELQGLPLVYAKAPLLWIPRALRDRVCAILGGLLQDAVQPRDAELANLLLFHSGQLLLRLPPSSSEEDPTDMQQEDIPMRGTDGRGVDESDGAKIQGIVARFRERVALAEKGALGAAGPYPLHRDARTCAEKPPGPAGRRGGSQRIGPDRCTSGRARLGH